MARGVTSSTCSRLSSTSSSSRSARKAFSASSIDWPLLWWTASDSAIACGTTSGWATAASGANRAPSANRPATVRATSSASRVFPVPPAPVSVSRRTPGREDQRPDLRDLAAAADERGHGRRQIGPAPGARAVERGIVHEDPLLEPAELLAGFEPELLDERRACVLVRRQRLGLAARPVERQHQLPGEALAQRVGPGDRGELSGELGVAAGGELVLETAFEGGQAKLLEPSDLGLGEVLEREVGERLAPPQRERLRMPILREQLAEAVQVQLAGAHAQDVTRGPRLQPAGPEQPAQPGHVAVQLGHGRGGRRLAPQRVKEPVLRDDLVRVQQQVAEQRALATALDRKRAAILHHLQRPQDPELDVALLGRDDATGPAAAPIAESLAARSSVRGVKSFVVELQLSATRRRGRRGAGAQRRRATDPRGHRGPVRPLGLRPRERRLPPRLRGRDARKPSTAPVASPDSRTSGSPKASVRRDQAIEGARDDHQDPRRRARRRLRARAAREHGPRRRPHDDRDAPGALCRARSPVRRTSSGSRSMCAPWVAGRSGPGRAASARSTAAIPWCRSAGRPCSRRSPSTSRAAR